MRSPSPNYFESREIRELFYSIYPHGAHCPNTRIWMADTTPRSGSDCLTTLLCSLVLFSVITSGYAATLAKGGCKKIGHTHLIDELGCDLVAVKVNRCSGYCWSFSFPNPKMDNQLTVHAKCCRMLETEMVDVQLNCNNEVRMLKIPSALTCGCFDCA
ncbi:hypothetical protein QR680_006558 [Steinernema hermaphroditum]|uniref:CTCK domain-containing protein n=1 Tax=Steinernema hermaphroditum TaxID=289476 RepID=A0AA39HXB4_9BILA|nr:hypothetical protein QR680_006558 [Steinernema hermaphroditum]